MCTRTMARQKKRDGTGSSIQGMGDTNRERIQEISQSSIDLTEINVNAWTKGKVEPAMMVQPVSRDWNVREILTGTRDATKYRKVADELYELCADNGWKGTTKVTISNLIRCNKKVCQPLNDKNVTK